LKSARPEKGEIAESDLRNESNLLRFAHTNGRVPGLQAPPSPVFSFITPEGVNRVGYLTQVYNGGKMYDNKNFKPGGMSFNDKLDCLDQLLIGRENMGKLGIKHGDLKPNNTLLNHDENGNWELAISDFGGCVKYENITPQDVRADPYVGGKDPAYMTSQDRARLEGLATKYPDTPEGNKAMMNEFRTLSEARDTYAIGRTVWQIVTGDEAGAISGDQQPRYTGEDGKVSDTLSKQLDSWGPALNDLKSLISDMCQIEPDKRISPSEARQRMDAIMDKHKEKLNPDILSAEKAVEQSLGKVRNKNLANEEMLKKLGPEQAKLAKTTQQLSNAFKEMKLIENAHTLMTAKPPVLDKKGKAAAQAFLEEKGAWVKGKYDQKALKFNAGSETFEMVSRSSMSKGDIQQSIDTAYALIKETSQKVPAIKVHVFDIGSRDIPGGILKANPELGDKGYKEPNLSWANPSTVASGLGRSTLVKEFSTPEHDKLEKDATGYDVNSRYAGREAPGALNIVNHNANGAIVDLVENRLRVKPDEDATRDLQAIKDKGVRENFASTINKGLAEFQKDINQQDKQIFTKFSQAMADGNREQFVNIMRTGIEALASKLDDKDPQKAILKKMREDVKEIAGSRSWERVAESWDAFGKMVLALSKE
jgi:serine/threonine protein kinase